MSSHTRHPEPRFIGIAYAATEFSVSQKLIRKCIASGELKAFRINGSRVIRIKRDDLEALMQPVIR
ncbi:helix-turn-helix domain-containing protein [Mycobacterium sp. FLAC0960]|uniref:DNA-binding protein n=1 Tax=Mycobacterium colombiense TaxID=339268 RepID=A0A329M8I3_9MYCO|nr:DNA-binding protein [Mycobacterium colombiense]